MAKIMYVDNAVQGHHFLYLHSLLNEKNENILVLPEKIPCIDCKQYFTRNNEDTSHRTIFTFIKWLYEIKTIVKNEKPDMIHFLYGDSFYRYFFLVPLFFRNERIITTFHWIRESRMGRFCTRCLCGNINMGVVHSSYLLQFFEKCGVKNVQCIEYPVFNEQVIDSKTAKAFWGIHGESKVIAAIGGTRYDKGLDILLAALKTVKAPFVLLIAGTEQAFDNDYIEQNSKEYSESVIKCLRYLSEQEMLNAICASDYVCVPYRNSFSGASGPMTDGVWQKKCIIGPNHGNLGNTIENYHLGYIFEAENVSSLSAILEKALTEDFFPDHCYIQYRESIKLESFRSEYYEAYKIVLGQHS